MKNLKNKIITLILVFFITLSGSLGLYINIENQHKPLYGKTVTLIGDSITKFNSTSGYNWAMYLHNWGGAKVQNLGIGGTSFCGENNYKERINKIDSNTDLIGVAISFNYTGGSIDIGSPSDVLEDGTLCGYANDFFDALVQAYPDIKIIAYFQCISKNFNPTNDDAKLYIDCMAQICQNHDIKFYDDMFTNDGALNPNSEENAKTYYSFDNILTFWKLGTIDYTHPNSKGHKEIAKYLVPIFIDELQ